MTMSSSLSTSFICPEVEPRAPKNTMASMAVSSNGDSTRLRDAIWPLPVTAVHILNDSSLHRSANRRTSSPRNATLASRPMLSCGAGCNSTVDGDALLLISGRYALDDGPGCAMMDGVATVTVAFGTISTSGAGVVLVLLVLVLVIVVVVVVTDVVVAAAVLVTGTATGVVTVGSSVAVAAGGSVVLTTGTFSNGVVASYDNRVSAADKSANFAACCVGPPVELTLNTVIISRPGSETRDNNCSVVVDSNATPSVGSAVYLAVDSAAVVVVAVVNSYGSCVNATPSVAAVVSLKSDLTVACFLACSVDDECVLPSPTTVDKDCDLFSSAAVTFSYGRSPISWYSWTAAAFCITGGFCVFCNMFATADMPSFSIESTCTVGVPLFCSVSVESFTCNSGRKCVTGTYCVSDSGVVDATVVVAVFDAVVRVSVVVADVFTAEVSAVAAVAVVVVAAVVAAVIEDVLPFVVTGTSVVDEMYVAGIPVTGFTGMVGTVVDAAAVNVC